MNRPTGNGSPQRINLRKSHPGLHHSILTAGIMAIALAVNFWTSTPAFTPYEMSGTLLGAIFAAIGTGQLVFLVVVRSLKMVRVMLTVSLTWLMFWGLSNTQQFFAGDASLQLPILYVAVSILQVPLLIESPVNPFTEKD